MIRRLLPGALLLAALANLAAAINTDRAAFGYAAAGFFIVFLLVFLRRTS